MGAAAPQRREYGWLLVAERLPFFFLSVTFLYEEAIRSLTCFRLQFFFLESKQFFSFFGDAEDLFATALCQDILMALAVRCMKLRERESGWVGLQPSVTADCAGLLLLLKDDELFFAALCT